MPWKSSEVIGLLVGSGLLTIVFVVSQWLLDDRAMLVPKLLKTRVVAIGMAYGFLHEGAFFLLLYYIPIYFQAVDGVLPTEAGVRNLPLLLSCGFGSLASGILISRFGHFVPLMVLASAGSCIGAGLIFTLDVDSPSSKWIGYQVLAGLAFGSGLPLAIIAGQAKALPEDLPSTTAMLLFAFNVGTSTALAAGQSVFDNLLLTKLVSTAPDVDPSSVVSVGATEIRTAFPPHAVPGIVDAYLYSLHAVYAIVIAYVGAAALVAMANKWESLKLKS
ncbi:hypothetical protein MMC18_000572 [Xylographa bjoerkii]|nr:hypothetical protein [Xylographa bjoerkii]